MFAVLRNLQPRLQNCEKNAHHSRDCLTVQNLHMPLIILRQSRYEKGPSEAEASLILRSYRRLRSRLRIRP
jgi:hypothetical protein